MEANTSLVRQPAIFESQYSEERDATAAPRAIQKL